VSEETRAPSSPDDIEVTTDDPPASSIDPKAARRARRAKAKMALRIPDDEIERPKTNGEAERPPEAAAEAAPTEPAEEIKPSRIISVGPPPPVPDEAKTKERIPSSPPTAPLDDADIDVTGDDDNALTPAMPPVGAKTVVDAAESEDIDVPVDEDLVAMRPKIPTLPSNPPPAPTANDAARAKAPSEDALEIDDVEAAAVLSSRPPPKPLEMKVTPPSIPTAPRVPAIAAPAPNADAPTRSSKPPPPTTTTATTNKPVSPPPAAATAPTPPLSPPIPADAMSSTPQLADESRPRPVATALVDDEEARGIEEIEPDRSSAPPSVDSGDEIRSTDVLVAVPSDAAAATPARPVSTPPKVPAAKPPLPFRETLKDGAVLAPKETLKEKDKEPAARTGGMIPIVGLSSATPAAGVPSPLAPPPLQESLIPRRRVRPWWEDLFNDDFIRTMSKFTDAQVAEEVDFIEDSLGVAKGGTMLDLGCGTGRHAIDLSRRGYSVVGFDLSLAMLARAGEEAQERNQKLNFVQGDMREMTFDEAFDGIYCWGSTFGYFEEDKNVHVLTRVHKALRHGGQFLLDVVSRDFVIKQAPSLAWFEGEGCVCMDEMQVDWITSRMRVKRTMMLDDGRSKEIEYSMRIYSLHELGKLLHDNGFRVAEISGRIQTPGVFFGPDSPRTLILAEKR